MYRHKIAARRCFTERAPDGRRVAFWSNCSPASHPIVPSLVSSVAACSSNISGLSNLRIRSSEHFHRNRIRRRRGGNQSHARAALIALGKPSFGDRNGVKPHSGLHNTAGGLTGSRRNSFRPTAESPHPSRNLAASSRAPDAQVPALLPDSWITRRIFCRRSSTLGSAQRCSA